MHWSRRSRAIPKTLCPRLLLRGLWLKRTSLAVKPFSFTDSVLFNRSVDNSSYRIYI